MILCEAGVYYSFDENDLKIRGSYTWRHIPTGQTGFRKVFTTSSDDFYYLINYWNSVSNNWKYVGT
jgi:hypothetical protein